MPADPVVDERIDRTVRSSLVWLHHRRANQGLNRRREMLHAELECSFGEVYPERTAQWSQSQGSLWAARRQIVSRSRTESQMLSSRRRKRRSVQMGFRGATIMLSLLPAVALGAITITAPGLSLPYSTASQTGSFEVFVQSAASPQPQVSAMGVELQLPSFSTITFDGSSTPTTVNTTPTAHPYIFPGQSPARSAVDSGRTVEGQDFASSSYPTLSNGAGLLLVSYTVPAGASGFFPLTFVDYSSQNVVGTALFMPGASGDVQIPTADQNGSITIVPPTAYWRGAVDGIWTTDNLQTGTTNWTIDSAGTTDTHIAPGVSTDVFFVGSGAMNLNTTLGGDFSIKGLNFTSTATSPVTIGGNNTLTIGADGLTVQSGSAAHTIKCGITLCASQTWRVSNSNSSPLTVTGRLNVPAAVNLTKTDNGGLVFTGAPQFGNGSSLAVNGGAVRFNLTSGSAIIGTGVTAAVAAGSTLELAGTVSALSSSAAAADRVNIINSSLATGGGLLVSGKNQQVGAITGTGNLTLNPGSSLTANSVRQAAIIIGGSAGNLARLTIAASDSSGNSFTDSLLGALEPTEPFAVGLAVFGRDGVLADSGPVSEARPSFLTGPREGVTVPPSVGLVPEPSSCLMALLAAGISLLVRLSSSSRAP
jgi:hypothetical protein